MDLVLGSQISYVPHWELPTKILMISRIIYMKIVNEEKARF